MSQGLSHKYGKKAQIWANVAAFGDYSKDFTIVTAWNRLFSAKLDLSLDLWHMSIKANKRKMPRFSKPWKLVITFNVSN